MSKTVELDIQGRPVLSGVARKLVVLERRRDFLQEKIAEGHGPGAGKSREFAIQEVDALGVAIVALRFHMAVIEGLDEPVSVLREVVEAYDGPANQEGRLRAAIRRARTVVSEFGALLRSKAS